MMIECGCVDEIGDIPHRIRWFDPNMMRLMSQTRTSPGDPYHITSGGSAVATLVIPTFSDSTSGIYTCGIGTEYPPPGYTTINLILSPGKD